MLNCLRCTGIVSVLIGLQLFTPKLIDTQGTLSLLTQNSSSPSVVASSGSTPQGLKPANLSSSSEEFDPPNNDGPDNTRGSGTR